MNRILINATQHEELRVALVSGQLLYDFDVERPGQEQKKANIYKGRITRIEPSLEAAFVNYGSARHGFLPLKEVAREYFTNPNIDPTTRPHIKDILKEGQEVIVQIDKEERGNKGAALTTFISLAGSYMVLMPNNPGAGGISRRIEGENRDELREIMRSINVPEDTGLIVRTAGVGRSQEELQWDLDLLQKQWAIIKEAAENDSAPFLIYQESNAVMRAIRDYLRQDIHEIIIDHQGTYDKVKKHIGLVKPDYVNKVVLYQESVPLFQRFQIESQIETAYQREVSLPSGGAIVIDRTEALTTIDINSARSTKGGDIEETAFHTNREAAHEIARQLRIRDTGGLIVIDFIDMNSFNNQRDVENALREATKTDRARIQISRISRFGLLEMSRQRLRSSLEEASLITCPRCSGYGSIRNVESLAISLLRLLREEAMKPNTARVILQAPVGVATFLLNEKRDVVETVQNDTHTAIVIIPNVDLETPHYHIERIKRGELSEQSKASYNMKFDVKEAETTPSTTVEANIEIPAVDITQITPELPAPSSSGLLARFFKSIAKFFTSNKKSTRHSTQKRYNRGGYKQQRYNKHRRNRPNQRSQQRRSYSRDNRNQQSRQQDNATTTDENRRVADFPSHTQEHNNNQDNNRDNNNRRRGRRRRSNRPQHERSQRNPHYQQRDNTPSDAASPREEKEVSEK